MSDRPDTSRETAVVDTTPELRFDAFISYRRKDGSWHARILRRRLLEEPIPKDALGDRSRRLEVYLDQIYERATEDFFERTIKPALAASRHLVVVQSASASEPLDDGRPNWLVREIEYFLTLPREGRSISVAITSGAFIGDLAGDLHRTFPNIERLDLRSWRWYRQGVADEPVLTLAATLLDIPPDRMPLVRQEDGNGAPRNGVCARWPRRRLPWFSPACSPAGRFVFHVGRAPAAGDISAACSGERRSDGAAHRRGPAAGGSCVHDRTHDRSARCVVGCVAPRAAARPRASRRSRPDPADRHFAGRPLDTPMLRWSLFHAVPAGRPVPAAVSGTIGGAVTTDRVYTVRQVGVCGSSKGLPKAAAELCRAIGRRLAREGNVAIVSGGTKRRNSAIGVDNYAAEWFVVSAAEREIPHERVADRIVTVINDDDGSRTTRFRIGSAQSARGKTSEARRISFVRGLDALIAIGGSGGTRQELALAVEFRIPILPVPGFGGAAQEVWKAYRSELLGALCIDDERARLWENGAIGRSFEPQPLADQMVEALLGSLPKRCFVIMPFRVELDALYDSIIEPAILQAGDAPVRVDRVGVTGNITTQVENGLRTCDYAIAVLDYLTPNVLYELGAAHALGKRAILVNRQGGLGSEGVPFDIYTQQRLEYTELDATLLTRLTRMVRAVSTPRQ